MKRIELTDQEVEILAGILEFYLSELRMEIVDTKRIAMREAMKDLSRTSWTASRVGRAHEMTAAEKGHRAGIELTG